jgi:5-methylcytosine-specific restriction endonuclease McrA
MGDKRKEYNTSWENLKKGPKIISENAIEKSIYKTCLCCGNEIRVPKSLYNRKKFCSLECKNQGQSKGLTAPMRKGTGMNKDRKILSGKYDRYKKRDGELDFTREEFYEWMETSSCYYCGSDETHTLGLDRIDNDKGHNKDNVVVACELCNTTKGHRFTIEQMKQIGKLIETFDMKGWRVMSEKSINKMKGL